MSFEYEDENEEPIFNAIDDQNLALVRSILETDPKQLKAVDAEGNTPLTLAAHIANLQIINLILDQPGVDMKPMLVEIHHYL